MLGQAEFINRSSLRRDYDSNVASQGVRRRSNSLFGCLTHELSGGGNAGELGGRVEGG